MTRTIRHVSIYVVIRPNLQYWPRFFRSKRLIIAANVIKFTLWELAGARTVLHTVARVSTAMQRAAISAFRELRRSRGDLAQVMHTSIFGN